MSSSGVLQLNNMQDQTTLLAKSSDMIELTDEDLAQVTGANGADDIMEHMMEHMHEGCDLHGRHIRFRLTRVRMSWRFEWLNVSLKAG